MKCEDTAVKCQMLMPPSSKDVKKVPENSTLMTLVFERKPFDIILLFSLFLMICSITLVLIIVNGYLVTMDILIIDVTRVCLSLSLTGPTRKSLKSLQELLNKVKLLCLWLDA